MIKILYSIALALLMIEANIAVADTTWTEYPEDGVQLGSGWDAFQGKKVNSNCIAAASEQVDRTQSSYTTIGELYDKEQLIQGLNISVDVEAHALLGSGSAKAKYVTSRDVSTETMNVAIYSQVINGAHYLGLPQQAQKAIRMASTLSASNHPTGVPMLPGTANRIQSEIIHTYASGLKLTGDKEKLWKNNRKEFFKECGTHYVAAFRDGAELIAFLSTGAITANQKTDLGVALSGSYFGQTASSDINSTLNKLTNVTSFNLDMRKSGGWGSTQPIDKDGLLQAVAHLPSDAATAPWHIQIAVSTYDSLLHEPDNPDPNEKALEDLFSRYWRFETIYNDFLLVDAHRSDYLFDWGVSSSDFDNALSGVKTAMSTIRNLASDCYSKLNCNDIRALPSTYDYRPLLPIRRGAFPEDVSLRDSAAKAQAAVAQFNQQRSENMKTVDNWSVFGSGCGNGLYEPNHWFTQWSEPTWLNSVWPLIAGFENNLQAYPSALRNQIIEVRMSQPWRAVCKPDGDDQDCLPVAELRQREDRIIVLARHDFVNGTGVWPGGQATVCGDNITAQFDPKID